MATVRNMLNYDYVIPALLRGESYEKIALTESVRLDTVVSRNAIAGVARDLKNGTIMPSSIRQPDNNWIDTYVYGVEADNGGLPLFTGHMTVYGDAVVTNDWHSPFLDYNFAETVIPWAKHYGVKQMIIAGDMTDGNSQNSFKKKNIAVPYHVEIEMTRRLLQYYAEYFDKIVFEPGNHDDWFFQNLDGHITISDFFNLLGVPELRGKLVMTPYDRVTLISGGEKWTIPHQAEASQNPLTVGDKLAQKFQSNVIVPHQHGNADGFDRYDRYRIIDSGGLFDPAKFGYTNLKTTTRPVPKQGFVIVKDGWGGLITQDRRQTNWNIIGR